MTQRARVLLLIALGFAAGAGPLEPLAQAEDVSPEVKLDARRHFENAQALYKNRDFQAALEGYSRAYELFPRPEFLFNIGQCHRNLNQHEKALYFYEKYLEQITDAGERQRVSDLIMALNIPQKRKDPPLPAVPAPAPEPGSARTIGTTDISTSPTSPSVSRAAEPDSRSLTGKWWFWTLIGVGVAAAAGGVVLAATQKENLPSGSIGTFDYR